MAANDPTPAAVPEDTTGSFMDWAQANANKLSIAGIAVAAIVAVALFMRAAGERKAVNASQALASAQNVFLSGNAALAQSDLQAVVRRYGGTTAATQARMLLAQLHFGQGKAEDGLRELAAVVDPGPFASSFHSIRAAGLEMAGKPAEAAAAFERGATPPEVESFEAFPDDEAVFWLALAATQWRSGRLLSTVKKRAIDIIDAGGDLERFPPRLRSSRTKVLVRLRETLTSRQPIAAKIRKRRVHNTLLEVGDLLEYKLLSGRFVIFRVIGHHEGMIRVSVRFWTGWATSYRLILCF